MGKSAMYGKVIKGGISGLREHKQKHHSYWFPKWLTFAYFITGDKSLRETADYHGIMVSNDGLEWSLHRTII